MHETLELRWFETLDGVRHGEKPDAGKTIRLIPFQYYHERSDPVVEVLHHGKVWQVFSWAGVRMIEVKLKGSDL